MDKKQNNITEGMFSTIDQIRQDSKDVRDFVKKVFADREFKKMSKDKEFIKYLKSIYEGTLLDEEAVAVSTRSADGTITTRIKEDIINEAKDEVTPQQLSKIQKDIKKINRKIKVYISKHPIRKGKLEIELGGDHPFANGDDREISKIDKVLKKHTGTHRIGTIFLESVNEAFVVAYGKGPKPIKPAFAAYADKKMAQKFMADMKKDGYKVMMTQKKIRGIDEGKKRYNQKDGVGKSKYVISYHDGKKKHKDGSDFFDIQIFRNKKDLAKFVNTLHKGGYVYGFNESINEILTIVDKFDAKKQDYDKMYYKDGGDRPGDGNLKKANKELERLSKKHKGLTLVSVGRNSKMYDVHNSRESVNEASREAMGIAGFTGTRGSAVQKFIDDYNLNSRKLFNFVKKGKLKDRMDFVTAIAGKPGNKFQGKMVGMFGEGKDDGVPQGYNPMVESKTKESKVVQMIYKYEKNEKKFYDKMAEHERRIGPRDYGKFIINALRGFGINPRQFKRVPDAEEKLYQTVSKK